MRIGDTVFGALAQIVPDLMPACGANAPEVGVSFGGTDHEGRAHVYLEFLVGSWGGGPDRDGMDACTGTLVNYANTPAELIEADLPIAVERYGFAADTGGAGRWRGGLSLERHLRFKLKRGVLQIRSDRRDHLAYGLEGGCPGAPANASIMRADGTEERFPSKFLTSVGRDDVLRVRLSGGGGHGDPLAREPWRVLADLREEKVTREHAEAAYGVVLSGAGDTIDEEATRVLRQQRAKAEAAPKG